MLKILFASGSSAAFLGPGNNKKLKYSKMSRAPGLLSHRVYNMPGRDISTGLVAKWKAIIDHLMSILGKALVLNP